MYFNVGALLSLPNEASGAELPVALQLSRLGVHHSCEHSQLVQNRVCGQHVEDVRLADVFIRRLIHTLLARSAAVV